MDGEIGAFCDGMRDAVKGSVMYRERPGFVNGGRDLRRKSCTA